MKPFHRLFRFKTEINIDMNIYTSLAHCHVYTKPAEKFRYPINVMILKRGKAARENSVSNTVSPGKSSSKIVIKSTARSNTKLLTLIMFSQSLTVVLHPRRLANHITGVPAERDGHIDFELCEIFIQCFFASTETVRTLWCRLLASVTESVMFKLDFCCVVCRAQILH